MNSIHLELKLIIEDELFDKLGKSISTVQYLSNLIAKIDITFSFAEYLRNLPKNVQICRPQIIK
jgi:hypothetical protein